MTTSGWKLENRKQQNNYWLHHIIKEELGNKKYQQLKENNTLIDLEQALENGNSIYKILENL